MLDVFFCIPYRKRGLHNIRFKLTWSNKQKQPVAEVFLNLFQYSQENIYVEGLKPVTLSKRDSNKGIFLWILQHFKEQLSYRTPPVAASEQMKISCYDHAKITVLRPTKILSDYWFNYSLWGVFCATGVILKNFLVSTRESLFRRYS